MAETLSLLEESWGVMPGHGKGLRGPLLTVIMRTPAEPKWDTEAMHAALQAGSGLAAEEIDRCLQGGFGPDAFLQLVLAMETLGHTSVMQPGVLLAEASRRQGWVQYPVLVPTFNRRYTRDVIEWLVLVANLRGGEKLPAAAQAKLDASRRDLRTELGQGGVNTMRIARACHELDLPLRWLTGNYLQVGSGCHGHIFQSTMTERTPAVGTKLARSKYHTAAVLAQHGLPVPRHVRAATADAAVRAAHELGYPVVVKPDDRDGGDGVHAGLRTNAQVRQCHAHALSLSNAVLVEKHVDGNDYRITVHDGRVVKAIGRRAGGVDGDGVRTVAELVQAALAAAPASRDRATLVSLDDEARELLALRGMTAASVPPAGEFVALRRRANMSTGGTAHDVMEQMHPDNAQLAVRAAQALRLDLAGVDLIIPDIAVSWTECTAGICEVNSQPQISTEFAPQVYRDLLLSRVQPPARLRAVLVLDDGGAPLADGFVTAIAARLESEGEQVVAVRSDGNWLGRERLSLPGREPASAAWSAELEPRATAVVAALTPAQMLKKGVPWLHVDEVHVRADARNTDAMRLKLALALLAPHVRGEIRMPQGFSLP
ncbi:MAG: acetate--CoA ligase family protein [Burkholderiales bacterium]|nr:acetate--CoA ligase family protein [Burkholderiales bacterium]